MYLTLSHRNIYNFSIFRILVLKDEEKSQSNMKVNFTGNKQNKKDVLKGIKSIISSDPPCKNENGRLMSVTLKSFVCLIV